MSYRNILASIVGGLATLCFSLVVSAPARADVDVRCNINGGEQVFRLRLEKPKRGRRHLAILSAVNVNPDTDAPHFTPIQMSAVKVRSDRSKRVVGLSGKGLKVVLNMEALHRYVVDGNRMVRYDANGAIAATSLRQMGFDVLPLNCTVVRTKKDKGDQCPTDDEPSCDGDVNGDNVIDPLDVGYITTRLGCTPESVADCLTADLNGDSYVDPLDLGYLYARWDSCPAS